MFGKFPANLFITLGATNNITGKASINESPNDLGHIVKKCSWKHPTVPSHWRYTLKDTSEVDINVEVMRAIIVPLNRAARICVLLFLLASFWLDFLAINCIPTMNSIVYKLHVTNCISSNQLWLNLISTSKKSIVCQSWKRARSRRHLRSLEKNGRF